MELGGERGTPGDDECGEGRQLCLKDVDGLFQTRNMFTADGLRLLGPSITGRCQISAQDKEVTLNEPKDLVYFCRWFVSPRDAKDRIQFIDSSIGLDPQRILRDTLTPEQRCLTTITGLGIDLHGTTTFKVVR
jgi:hypothetical protein